MLPCPFCSAAATHQKCGTSIKGLQRYRCRECGRKFTSESKVRPKAPKPEPKPCQVCGKITMNPKYCSRSCAASQNNRIHPKRFAPPNVCINCGIQIPHQRIYCVRCSPYSVDWMKRTKGEIQRNAKYQVSAQLRELARRTYQRAQIPRVCRNCGYDKHVEICHIRALNSFPDNTPIAVINDLSNLIALCPNCHWEFDHGLLKLD